MQLPIQQARILQFIYLKLLFPHGIINQGIPSGWLIPHTWSRCWEFWKYKLISTFISLSPSSSVRERRKSWLEHKIATVSKSYDRGNYLRVYMVIISIKEALVHKRVKWTLVTINCHRWAGFVFWSSNHGRLSRKIRNFLVSGHRNIVSSARYDCKSLHMEKSNRCSSMPD